MKGKAKKFQKGVSFKFLVDHHTAIDELKTPKHSLKNIVQKKVRFSHSGSSGPSTKALARKAARENAALAPVTEV